MHNPADFRDYFYLLKQYDFINPELRCLWA
ncbi:hypothetical protein BN2476_680080 [Paraburkholderia piptadeniae]|uniref:Uncharacterized protein n=1 Tax=Paraburkholderia piptadeniae TaxID=1701573 RepID=A0A1N7SPT0_9BURK|nr:hypothetical protein BN2476_680080 [Paraburkholderia piptadeniae]